MCLCHPLGQFILDLRTRSPLTLWRGRGQATSSSRKRWPLAWGAGKGDTETGELGTGAAQLPCFLWWKKGPSTRACSLLTRPAEPHRLSQGKGAPRGALLKGHWNPPCLTGGMVLPSFLFSLDKWEALWSTASLTRSQSAKRHDALNPIIRTWNIFAIVKRSDDHHLHGQATLTHVHAKRQTSGLGLLACF